MSALRTSIASVTLVLAGAALLAGATDGFQAFTSEAARRVAVHERVVMAPPVALETETGDRINLADLRGKWLLVDFIYTGCQTLCLSLGSDFARLEGELAGPIASGRVRLLSISFDPSSDSPRELAAYLERFHRRGPGWLAARPTNEAGLIELKRRFGVTVVADGLGGYVHNSGIHLVDPQGRIVEILDLGAPGAIVQALRRYGVT
ncbi:MAG: SCO family protein, partial [Burkholderiales bacterium]